MKPTTIKILGETRKALVQEIKEILPHGYKAAIAKKAGVTYATVVKFFNGDDNRKVYRVFTEYVEEYMRETKKLASAVDLQITGSDRVYVEIPFLIGLGVESDTINKGIERNDIGLIKTWRNILNPIDNKTILIDYGTIPEDVKTNNALPKKEELDESNPYIHVIPENF